MRTLSYGLWGRLLWITFIVLIFVLTFKCKLISIYYKFTTSETAPLWEQSLDFDLLHFSNETGNPSGCYVVPNYIHFLHFGGDPMTYTQLICVLAAFKNQRPQKIFFHYDLDTTFSGKYWKILEETPGFLGIVEWHEIALPDSIFGQSLSSIWRNWHGSDVMRIKIIMKYGGIFLDNDCYLVRSIDNYRRFEISIGWDEGQSLGNQVIVAHKDARFLTKWLDTYKVYHKKEWYYNAGERPTTEVLHKEPQLIHRVKVLFGVDTKFIHHIFRQQWKEWRDMYVIHLLIRHQYMFKSNLTARAVFPVEFNETNIAYYPVTFRDMAYEVYDIANIKWPKDKFDT